MMPLLSFVMLRPHFNFLHRIVVWILVDDMALPPRPPVVFDGLPRKLRRRLHWSDDEMASKADLHLFPNEPAVSWVLTLSLFFHFYLLKILIGPEYHESFMSVT